MPVQNCCKHKLTACDDEEDVIYTDSAGISQHVGKVVTLSTPDDPTCRTVEKLCGLPEGESWTAVVVDEVYDDCEECDCTCYSLTDCDAPHDVFYSDSDLSADVGTIVRVSGRNGKCFTVACESENCDEVESVTVTHSYDNCDTCLAAARPVTACETCATNTTPRRFKVVFSGIANSTCSNCASYNGTYYLDQINPTILPCNYDTDKMVPSGFPDPCETGDYHVFMSLQTTQIQIVLSAGTTGGVRQMVFNFAVANLRNCSSFIDQSVAVSSNTTLCSSASVTCLFTSIP